MLDIRMKELKSLDRMGKSWFVSYLYFLKIDRHHLNWKNVQSLKSLRSRISRFKQTEMWHKMYLNKIIKSNPNSLGTNNLGLSGEEIIVMSNELIKLI